jgi:hypothetical protein
VNQDGRGGSRSSLAHRREAGAKSARPARHPRAAATYRPSQDPPRAGDGESGGAMNLAALIGEVASAVEPASDDAVRFSLAVPPGGGDPQILWVQAGGRQAAACREYLRPGHRVAVEGRVAPGAEPAEVLAERVQFLTTRAQARALERAAA